MSDDVIKTCPRCYSPLEAGFAAKATGLSFIAPGALTRFAFLDEDLARSGLPKLLASKAEYFRSYLCRSCELYLIDCATALDRCQAEQVAWSITGDRAGAEPPGPRYDYPVDGQGLDLEGDYLFQVNEVPGASGYLWSFFQNGKMVWENLKNERKLSGRNYGLMVGSLGWKALKAGEVEVWCRACVNDQWTEATRITITLQPRKV